MNTKKILIIVGVVALVGVLITGAALATGAWAWRHWGSGAAQRSMMDDAWTNAQQRRDMPRFGMMGNAPWARGRFGSGFGPGMMGDGGTCGACTAQGQGTGEVKSLAEAQAAVESYVQDLDDSNLVVTEVMEFQYNYYAIVAEKDTGIGAMELIIDKSTGIVRPEQGPNMMWNAKYGMMARSGMMGRRGMMGGSTTGEMTLSPEEAADEAQRWLDDNMPGRTAGEADELYGYYTFHFLKDGKVDGMLSVNGSSGNVWYHSWHGDYIAGTEGD